MFKKLITQSEKTVFFWMKAYIYIFAISLLALPIFIWDQGSNGIVYALIAAVIVVFVVLEVNKVLKILGVINEIKKISLDPKLSNILSRLKWSLLITTTVDIFIFSWFLTFLPKVYFFHTLNNLKIYLGLKSEKDNRLR